MVFITKRLFVKYQMLKKHLQIVLFFINILVSEVYEL